MQHVCLLRKLCVRARCPNGTVQWMHVPDFAQTQICGRRLRRRFRVTSQWVVVSDPSSGSETPPTRSFWAKPMSQSDTGLRQFNLRAPEGRLALSIREDLEGRRSPSVFLDQIAPCITSP